MDEIFYGLLSFFMICYIIVVFSFDQIQADYTKLESYNGYIVTNITDFYLLPNMITIRNNENVYKFNSDDIIFNHFQVGDTINVDELRW